MLFRFILYVLPFLLINPIVASANFCSDQKSPKPIFCQDFQNHDSGLYDVENLRQDWPNLQSLSDKIYLSNFGVSQNRVSIEHYTAAKGTDKDEVKGDIKIAHHANPMLKIKYPENLFGSALSGATWVMKFPKQYQQLSLEFKVMFKEGFLYNREGLFGGKLPGLMGGETVSGGGTADGTNGWTSRLMWGQLGRGLGYLYYPDMRDDQYNQKACPRYGLDHELCVIKRNKYFTFDENSERKCLSEWASDEHEFRFKTERFYKIKQFIKMNTLNTAEGSSSAEGSDSDNIAQGNRDGQLKIWLDDKLVVDCNNIRFRDIPELAIDSLLFSTFFGGNTPESSAHPHDEYIYFDDFIVRED